MACSGDIWFADHHILITGKDPEGNVRWTVSLFSNDQQNAVLVWNSVEAYDGGTVLQGSAGDSVVSALFIGQRASGEVYVNWQGK